MEGVAQRFLFQSYYPFETFVMLTNLGWMPDRYVTYYAHYETAVKIYQ